MTGATAQEAAGSAVRQSLIWNAANFGVSQIASAALFFLMASRLSPELFGVLALSLLFTEFFTAQGKSALCDVLVQQQEFSSRTLSTTFHGANAISLIAMIGCCIVAPFAADWFHAPELTWMLPVIAVTILVVPATSIMESMIIRELRFRPLAIRNMVAVWIGGAVGLAFVFSPWLHWTLVAQRVAQAFASLVFLFLQTRWLPSGEFDIGIARRYGRAFLQIWSTQVLAVMAGQIGSGIIGWRLGADVLGVMRVARKFIEIVHGTVTTAVMSMWVPVMSRFGDDHQVRGDVFLRLMQLASMVCIPPLIGLSLISTELSALFLASEYAAVSYVLPLTALSGLFVPLSFFRSAVLAAIKRNSLGIKLAVFDIAVWVPVTYIATEFGLIVTLWAALACGLVTTIASGWLTVRAVGVSARAFLLAIAPTYVGVAVMSAIVLAISPLTVDMAPIAALILKTVVGAVSFVGWLWLSSREWLMSNVRFVQHRA